jgi:hypothetical protein
MSLLLRLLALSGMCLSCCVPTGLLVCVTIHFNLNRPICIHLDTGKNFDLIETTSEERALVPDIKGGA